MIATTGLLTVSLPVLTISSIGPTGQRLSVPCPGCGVAIITAHSGERHYRVHDVRQSIESGDVTGQCRKCNRRVRMWRGANSGTATSDNRNPAEP